MDTRLNHDTHFPQFSLREERLIGFDEVVAADAENSENVRGEVQQTNTKIKELESRMRNYSAKQAEAAKSLINPEIQKTQDALNDNMKDAMAKIGALTGLQTDVIQKHIDAMDREPNFERIVDGQKMTINITNAEDVMLEQITTPEGEKTSVDPNTTSYTYDFTSKEPKSISLTYSNGNRYTLSLDAPGATGISRLGIDTQPASPGQPERMEGVDPLSDGLSKKELSVEFTPEQNMEIKINDRIRELKAILEEETVEVDVREEFARYNMQRFTLVEDIHRFKDYVNLAMLQRTGLDPGISIHNKHLNKEYVLTFSLDNGKFVLTEKSTESRQDNETETPAISRKQKGQKNSRSRTESKKGMRKGAKGIPTEKPSTPAKEQFKTEGYLDPMNLEPQNPKPEEPPTPEEADRRDVAMKLNEKVQDLKALDAARVTDVDGDAVQNILSAMNDLLANEDFDEGQMAGQQIVDDPSTNRFEFGGQDYVLTFDGSTFRLDAAPQVLTEKSVDISTDDVRPVDGQNSSPESIDRIQEFVNLYKGFENALQFESRGSEVIENTKNTLDAALSEITNPSQKQQALEAAGLLKTTYSAESGRNEATFETKTVKNEQSGIDYHVWATPDFDEVMFEETAKSERSDAQPTPDNIDRTPELVQKLKDLVGEMQTSLEAGEVEDAKGKAEDATRVYQSLKEGNVGLETANGLGLTEMGIIVENAADNDGARYAIRLDSNTQSIVIEKVESSDQAVDQKETMNEYAEVQDAIESLRQEIQSNGTANTEKINELCSNITAAIEQASPNDHGGCAQSVNLLQGIFCDDGYGHEYKIIFDGSKDVVEVRDAPVVPSKPIEQKSNPADAEISPQIETSPSPSDTPEMLARLKEATDAALSAVQAAEVEFETDHTEVNKNTLVQAIEAYIRAASAEFDAQASSINETENPGRTQELSVSLQEMVMRLEAVKAEKTFTKDTATIRPEDPTVPPLPEDIERDPVLPLPPNEGQASVRDHEAEREFENRNLKEKNAELKKEVAEMKEMIKNLQEAVLKLTKLVEDLQKTPEAKTGKTEEDNTNDTDQPNERSNKTKEQLEADLKKLQEDRTKAVGEYDSFLKKGIEYGSKHIDEAKRLDQAIDDLDKQIEAKKKEIDALKNPEVNVDDLDKTKEKVTTLITERTTLKDEINTSNRDSSADRKSNTTKLVRIATIDKELGSIREKLGQKYDGLDADKNEDRAASLKIQAINKMIDDAIGPVQESKAEKSDDGTERISAAEQHFNYLQDKGVTVKLNKEGGTLSIKNPDLAKRMDDILRVGSVQNEIGATEITISNNDITITSTSLREKPDASAEVIEKVIDLATMPSHHAERIMNELQNDGSTLESVHKIVSKDVESEDKIQGNMASFAETVQVEGTTLNLGFKTADQAQKIKDLIDVAQPDELNNSTVTMEGASLKFDGGNVVETAGTEGNVIQKFAELASGEEDEYKKQLRSEALKKHDTIKEGEPGYAALKDECLAMLDCTEKETLYEMKIDKDEDNNNRALINFGEKAIGYVTFKEDGSVKNVETFNANSDLTSELSLTQAEIRIAKKGKEKGYTVIDKQKMPTGDANAVIMKNSDGTSERIPVSATSVFDLDRAIIQKLTELTV